MTDTLLLGNVTGKELSPIKDPFKKDCVKEIMIRYSQMWSSDPPYWYANIEFKNGNTEAKQRTPNCETFEEVIVHMKQILNSL